MDKWNSVYEKTYNFVYLRAKCILEKEDEIQQLMKEVYLKTIIADVAEAQLYEWLAKQVYVLGCGRFRKKKSREAELIELEEAQYSIQESVDREETKEVICENLENLPDLYLATVYACYYDHMRMKEIAAIMGQSVGVILNRLNYVHKYLDKALANYKEDYGVNVQFSVEILCEALRDWSAKNQLNAKTAQHVYASICRELGTVAEEDEIECGVAGANCRCGNLESDDVDVIVEELKKYSVKRGIDKKQLLLAVVLVVLVLLVAAGVFALRKPSSEKKKDEVKVEQSEEVVVPSQDVEEPQETSEYILPKSGTEKLSRADLQGLTKEQLRLARNEIYARHGMIFGVEDLDQYFAGKSWYKPTVSFTDFYDTVEMSIVEEENVMLIQQVEKEK